MTCNTAGGRPSALLAGMVSFCRLVICLAADTLMPESDNAPPLAADSETVPKSLARPDGATIAYHRLAGMLPGIVFLGGFRSDMTGTKALYLEEYCRRRERAYVRFDYFGHGASSGDFALGTIGRWRDDAVAVIDSLTEGKQILVGSSMSGWIMLLAALARPQRIAALLWTRLTPAQRREIDEQGRVVLHSEYDRAGYLYTRALIEDGRKHLLLGKTIPIDVPVRLLHGMRDESVPWRLSLRLAERLASRDVAVTLVKDGDHRLSTPADLALLAQTLDALTGTKPA